MKHYSSETAFICVRQLSQKFGSEATHEAFRVIADKITNALKLIPGCENYRVHFKNILERECNPDGFQAFFRITTYDPDAPLDLREDTPENAQDKSEPITIFPESFIAKE